MTLRWSPVAAALAIGIVQLACTPRSAAPTDAAHSESCSMHGRQSQKAETAFTAVGGSVFVATFSGGNVVVSKGADGLVVVDPRSADVDVALEAWAPGAARTVIDTHSHRDHTAGNAAVAKASGAIIAHAAVKTRLMAPQVFQGAPVPAAPKGDWPTRTYEDKLTLSFNGEAIELTHPAGAHTDGDTVVFFRGSHVVGMGDVFFPDRFPYVDPDGGGDVDALVRAIDGFVRDWPADTRIIPGHGRAVCTMADLRAYDHMLHESVAWVRAGREQGLSADALTSRGAPPAYRGWGWPLVPESLWVALVARSR